MAVSFLAARTTVIPQERASRHLAQTCTPLRVTRRHACTLSRALGSRSNLQIHCGLPALQRRPTRRAHRSVGSRHRRRRVHSAAAQRACTSWCRPLRQLERSTSVHVSSDIILDILAKTQPRYLCQIVDCEAAASIACFDADAVDLTNCCQDDTPSSLLESGNFRMSDQYIIHHTFKCESLRAWGR
jgi:hypothetical protein